MTTWIVALSAFVLFVGFLSYLLRRLSGASTPVAADPNWASQFDLNRYRPMQRLLAGEDEDFLVRECGYSRAMIRKVRAERRRVFRAYLSNLKRDFNRLHHTARMMLLESTSDRPELAEQLVRLRVSFSWAMIVVEYRLALHAAGVGTVDVRALLGSLEGVRTYCAVPSM